MPTVPLPRTSANQMQCKLPRAPRRHHHNRKPWLSFCCPQKRATRLYSLPLWGGEAASAGPRGQQVAAPESAGRGPSVAVPAAAAAAAAAAPAETEEDLRLSPSFFSPGGRGTKKGEDVQRSKDQRACTTQNTRLPQLQPGPPVVLEQQTAPGATNSKALTVGNQKPRTRAVPPPKKFANGLCSSFIISARPEAPTPQPHQHDDVDVPHSRGTQDG